MKMSLFLYVCNLTLWGMFILLVLREFCKRMDPELPFYFWTANSRYREWDEELPSFNERPHVDDRKIR